MQHLEVSVAVRHIYIYIYIYVIRRLKVNISSRLFIFLVSGVKTRIEVYAKYDNLKRGGDIMKYYTGL